MFFILDLYDRYYLIVYLFLVSDKRRNFCFSLFYLNFEIFKGMDIVVYVLVVLYCRIVVGFGLFLF